MPRKLRRHRSASPPRGRRPTSPRRLRLGGGAVQPTAVVPAARVVTIGSPADPCPPPNERACGKVHTVGLRNEGAAPEGMLYEMRPWFVKEWLDPSGATRWAQYGVRGDGACFFHSLAAILNYGGYLYARNGDARTAIVDTLRCELGKRLTVADVARVHAEEGVDDADADADPRSGDVPIAPSASNAQRLAAMQHDFCAPTAWANESEIRFAARALSVNLIFIDSLDASPFCGIHGDAPSSQLTGIVSWCNDHKHFQPVSMLRQRDDGAYDVQLAFDPAEPRDRAVITAVMAHYGRVCKDLGGSA